MDLRGGINETTQASAEKEKIDSKEPLDSTGAGQDKIISDDQKSDLPPDVSEFFFKLEDFESQDSMRKKYFTQLTEEEQEFIEKVNVILVTATDKEYHAVMGATHPTGGDHRYIKVITNEKIEKHFILGKFGPCNVAIINTGQGPDATDTILTSVQEVVKAKFVIAIGICYGAKESKTNLGDIIVAKSILNIEHQRSEETRIPFQNTYNCEDKLLNLFKHDNDFEIESKKVNVHVGDLASEFTLHRNEEEKQKILKYVPQALGGEMEANGINRVAMRQKFDWIVIKAIVDWGNEDKDKTWQDFAAVSCARFVLKCLEDRPGDGDPLEEL